MKKMNAFELKEALKGYTDEELKHMEVIADNGYSELQMDGIRVHDYGCMVNSNGKEFKYKCTIDVYE